MRIDWIGLIAKVLGGFLTVLGLLFRVPGGASIVWLVLFLPLSLFACIGWTLKCQLAAVKSKQTRESVRP